MRRDRERGQELAEYALALPVMLLMLMSILDLGRVVYAYSAVHNAVRDGARYGIINPSDSAGIEAVVRDKAVGLDQTELVVLVVQPDPQTIRIRAIYQFVVVSPIAGALIGSDRWQVASQSTMRVEA